MLNSTDASGAALDKAFEDAFALPEFSSLNLIAHQHFSPADQSVPRKWPSSKRRDRKS